MEQLSSVVHRTPLTTSATLNEQTGKNVFMKMENQQKTGAFKIRGASYKISQLTKHEMKRGVIAASAGNHAQGVALAAAKRGIEAKIFMPANTPKAKTKATEGYGAKIVLTGESFQEAYEAAIEEQKRSKAVFIHPFDDPDVMAGQGTIAIEMLEDQPSLDTLIVPVGGGGLISGIAFAAKSINPAIQVIGVQAEGASATYNQFHSKGATSLPSVSTIADGIAVKRPGEKTYPIIRNYVDKMITVSDQQIAATMVQLLEREKTMVEGAGATALAALLSYHKKINSHNCGVIVSGGNMDIAKLPAIQSLSQQNKYKVV
ncbi:threonine ammonia-lyase [Thalassobacillus devorans]|uniref:threonine ammonia-lyase n=1 Tax=Thalassobacillus devorans TaxID=279813 RepID=UPI000A1C9E9A|nr:threonine ammonia-lyase [Thalassobacillus devorans]